MTILSPSQVLMSAEFSPCRTWRYRLTREWAPGPKLIALLLNPSTADEKVNDPTVERCQRRALQMGFGGLVVLNAFALRSTDPAALYSHPDPVGPENDLFIRKTIQNIDTHMLNISGWVGPSMVLCGWGEHAMAIKSAAGWYRGPWLKCLMQSFRIPIWTLGINKSGAPKHPLYISYKKQPERWF